MVTAPLLVGRVTSRVEHGDGLDLDHHRRPCEGVDADQRAAGEAAGKILLADVHELVAVARISDEHRHGHHVVERAPHQRHGLPQAREDLMGLGRKVPRQGMPLGIDWRANPR
jgi:hypothetical protein